MKKTQLPPDTSGIFGAFSGLRKELESMPSPVMENGEYIHWDKLRHLKLPKGAAPEEKWRQLKTGRMAKMFPLPFADLDGKRFWFCQLPELAEFQHWIDARAAGVLGAEEPAAFNEERRTRFLMRGLKEEAIHSSILEGAATTRVVARQILAQDNPKPKTHGEKMIVNNYHAMQFVQDMKNEDLTMSAVLELHRILTEGTMDDPAGAGRLRLRDDIAVADAGGVLYRPPPAAELRARMENLYDFANGKTPDMFLHPALRAIILHFMLAVIHPFADGNGRTARALFYWAMARSNYWLSQYISISEIVRREAGLYKKAFLWSEADGGDLTYFLLNQTSTIRKAFLQLARHVKKETAQLQTGKWARKLAGVLNRRQIALLHHAEKHPGRGFSVYEHKARHHVSYPTARADLLALADMKILTRYKTGKEYVYEVREGALAELENKQKP